MDARPWRRRSMDRPRPLGRGWQRGLRRGGVLARTVLVGRGGAGIPVDGEMRVGLKQADPAKPARRFRTRRTTLLRPVEQRGRRSVAGVSGESGELTIPTPPEAEEGGDQPPSTTGEVELAPYLLTGPRTLSRRIRFALVTACSLSSLLCGTAAVMIAIEGQPRLGALLLLGSVIFDGLDGPLARKLKVTTPFGAQLDSLVDMCSFGVAAPIVSYVWLLQAGLPSWYVAPACVFVAAGAALRLARFNVSPKDDKFFCGVPTTNVAFILAVFLVVVPTERPVWWLPPMMAALGLLMTSSFAYAKLGQVLRLPPWLWMIALFGAVLIDLSTIFGLAALTYLASGPVISAWRHRPRRPSPAVVADLRDR